MCWGYYGGSIVVLLYGQDTGVGAWDCVLTVGFALHWRAWVSWPNRAVVAAAAVLFIVWFVHFCC